MPAFTVKGDVLPIRVTFVVTKTMGRGIASLRKLGFTVPRSIAKQVAEVRACCLHTQIPGHVAIILLTSDSDIQASLVHESVHAANYLLTDLDIPVSAHNDEAVAYVAEWVFRMGVRLINGSK